MKNGSLSGTAESDIQKIKPCRTDFKVTVGPNPPCPHFLDPQNVPFRIPARVNPPVNPSKRSVFRNERTSHSGFAGAWFSRNTES